jgi:hypothetical protein
MMFLFAGFGIDTGVTYIIIGAFELSHWRVARCLLGYREDEEELIIDFLFCHLYYKRK